MRGIINRRYHLNAQERLYRYADDVLEYRMKGGEDRYHQRADLGQVFSGLVEAAKVIKTDPVAAHTRLLEAAQVTDDREVVLDIYSVIAEIGYPCPAHGVETYLNVSGGFRLIAGEVNDDLEEHVICSLCGNEVEYTSSVQNAALSAGELAEIAPY